MSGSANVSALFQAAKQEGNLSPQAMTAINVIDIGQNIQNAMGTPAIDVQASSVILISVLVDDSGSIRFAGNTAVVREGVNLIKSALMKTKQTDGMLMSISYINGRVICPFVPIKDVPDLDTHNYDPNGGTPLYDQSLATLATVVAKTQEFLNNAVPVRAITVIVSDGADEHSAKATAKSCASVVKDMLMTESHIIAAMGIDDGGRTDFRSVFSEMGVPDAWILTPQNDPHSIRQAFQTVSQSAVRASQNAQSFSQTAMGGFGTP